MQDSLISLIISIVSAVISVIMFYFFYHFSKRQEKLTKRALDLGVSSDMFREFRSRKFKEAVEYIYTKFSDETKPMTSMSEIKANKESVERVSHFFDHLGVLVSEGIADENTVIKFMGNTILRVWEKLEESINLQREKANYEKFQHFFQQLVSLVKEKQGQIWSD